MAFAWPQTSAEASAELARLRGQEESSFVDEHAWRYNARREPLGFFEQLLRRAVS